MQPKWQLAAELLEAAAATIRERGTRRDSGVADTFDTAAREMGRPASEGLAWMLAIKRARFSVGHDYDSALDELGYQARRLVESLAEHVKAETDGFKPGPAIDPPEASHGEEAPMPPHLSELLARQMEEPQGLKAGEALNPVSQADEE